MCGIVGAAGQLAFIHEKMFEQLLIVDQLRGHHSTGVFVLGEDDVEPRVMKVLGTPDNLLMDRRYDDIKKGSLKVMCGHNRYATKGAVNKYNAHPFTFGNITGVHNGTLTTYFDLDNHQKFDVDSQVLYYNVDKQGAKSTMSKVSGAWAMVWWDSEEQRLNFLRNKERPLFICRTEDKKVWFWASEYWMLVAIASRNNVKIEEPYMIQEDTLTSITFDEKDRTPLDTRSETVLGKQWVVAASSTYSAKTAVTAPATKNTPKVIIPPEDLFDRTGFFGKIYVMGSLDNKQHFYGVRVEGFEDILFRIFVKDCPEGTKFGDQVLFDAHHARYFTGGLVVWIDPNTFEVVTAETPFVDEDDDDEGDGEETYNTHTGEKLPLDKWMKRYGSCSWCTDVVDPRDVDTKLCRDGTVICAGCSAYPEVSSYITNEVKI